MIQTFPAWSLKLTGEKPSLMPSSAMRFLATDYHFLPSVVLSFLFVLEPEGVASWVLMNGAVTGGLGQWEKTTMRICMTDCSVKHTGQGEEDDLCRSLLHSIRGWQTYGHPTRCYLPYLTRPVPKTFLFSLVQSHTPHTQSLRWTTQGPSFHHSAHSLEASPIWYRGLRAQEQSPRPLISA